MKFIYSILFSASLIFSVNCLHSLDYGLFARNEGRKPIKTVAVISEKCSGSHFVQQLIVFNLNLTAESFIHKHYPPWYMLPIEDYLDDSRHYYFTDTDDHLFVILFRNPYDWIRSLYGKPFHASDEFFGVSFSQFIRTPWKLNNSPRVEALRQIFPKIDRDPINGSLFANALKLRNAKIENMLMIKSRANNVYVLNYEVARDHPQAVLAEIGELFHLDVNSDYTPVITYKGKEDGKVYEEKEYVRLSASDLQFINSQLDITLERSIGYELVYKPEEIDN